MTIALAITRYPLWKALPKDYFMIDSIATSVLADCF